MKNNFMQFDQFVKTVEQQSFLFKNLWKEKTTALIHGQQKVDKVSLALDVAESVMASGQTVIYVATTNAGLRAHAQRLVGVDKMMVFEPAFESPDDKRDYADIVIQGIEEAVKEGLSKVFIVDSVSRMAALSFGRNASAAYVMKRLVALQVRLGISLLVIANDLTAATTRALVNLVDVVIPLPETAAEKESDRRSSAPAAGKYGNQTVINRYSGSSGANRQFLAKHPSR
ncbi:MAG: hypothetical protein K2J10_07040 [Muribaculaceae bacterium]|nr:hypothetical protein [Muribaculaceae bacterium]